MLDASTQTLDSAGTDVSSADRAARTRQSPHATQEPIAGVSVSPAQMVEGPMVAAASMMMAPYAFASEAVMAARRARGLSFAWMHALSRCKSPQDVIDVNARYGERALALGFGEGMRAFERGAMMGRRAVAPGSIALRDADPKL